MRIASWLWGLALLACVLGLAYGGWRAARRTETCYVCKRPLHAHSKTLAMINGHLTTFCCPACALSEHSQEGKPVTISRLTAFVTGEALSPDQAYIVRGSDVNICVKNVGLVDRDKHPADLHFDRCSPSMLAFARRDEAAQFARAHGGQVLAFHDVQAAFAR